MTNNEIGQAAGLIWKALESNGRCSVNQLKATTQLEGTLLSMALGWLAREEKISMERTGKKRVEVALR